jgi:hypothetical protein
MGEWISYKEENPPIKGINYIVCALDHGTQVVTMAKWISTGFVLTGRRAYWKVTHWMMLPHPPEE